MIELKLSELAIHLDAQIVGEDIHFSSVSTDSRSLTNGALFVALTGPRFDGHDYLNSAVESGAVAVVVDHKTAVNCPQLIVSDTRVALGQMAALWRQKSTAAVVAVTGSNGKTTVKEMIAAILGNRGSVLATQGNLNNDIGMPLTLLRLQEHQYAVIEMGANHPGEIDYLSKIAKPDVALLNNACRSHLEGFGSLEGVAKAKSEIVSGLAEAGCFVFNADDNFAPYWLGVAGGRKVCTFGVTQPADITSSGVATVHWDAAGFSSHFSVVTPQGAMAVSLALAGEHNRLNALAAIAAALQLGATSEDVVTGLASIKPVKGRLQPRMGRDGVLLIDDSYNANPDSVMAAIDVLATAPGRRFLLLGELGELGEGTTGFYQELGAYAKTSGIDRLCTVGAAGEAVGFFGLGGVAFDTREQLIETLQQELQSGDRVLIKGSRRAGMELIVNALVDPETV
jgi:UDP-N-acetylmuramoyl-tripeptide--D-alanyl-D-alanine ligase